MNSRYIKERLKRIDLLLSNIGLGKPLKSIHSTIKNYRIDREMDRIIKDEKSVKEITDSVTFNKAEYSIQDVNATYSFDNEIYFLPNSSLSIKQNRIECEYGTSEYISLFNDSYFTSMVSGDSKFYLDEEYEYYIDFKSRCEGKIYVSLFAIFYSETNKLDTLVLTNNSKVSFRVPKGATNVVFALKLMNEGAVTLEHIILTRKKHIDNLSKIEYRKLGYCDEDKISDIKVACIFDEFTTECFKPECCLYPITPYNWKAVLDMSKPHLFLCESAWLGNNGAWTRKVAYYNEINVRDLKRVIAYCKKMNIPTVFWNKEDPVHFEVFKRTAILFDYIFTTDKESIDRYRKITGKNNAYLLSFAAQVNTHNPIKSINRIEKACFAGSFYSNRTGERFLERAHDVQTLLDACLETIGVDIFDRKHGEQDINFTFPEKYQPYIKGKLEPYELEVANKGYKVMVNLNTVKNSSSMFARRVYEGLASGTPIVSNFSIGVASIFKDLIVSSDEKKDIIDELTRLSNDQCYYKEKQKNGVRSVHSAHTYKHRLLEICKTVGLKVNETDPLFGVISNVNNVDSAKRIIRKFNAQTYDNKILYLLISDHFNEISELSYSNDNVQCIYMPFYNENRINSKRVFKSSYLTCFDFCHEYNNNYLLDFALAFSYSKSKIVCFGSDIEYIYTCNIITDQYAIDISEFNTFNVSKCIDLLYNKEECSKLSSMGYLTYNI